MKSTGASLEVQFSSIVALKGLTADTIITLQHPSDDSFIVFNAAGIAVTVRRGAIGAIAKKRNFFTQERFRPVKKRIRLYLCQLFEQRL